MRSVASPIHRGPVAPHEMWAVLRTILEEHRFVPTDEPDEPLARRNATIAPGRGAVVRLERRAPSRRHVPSSRDRPPRNGG
jgi:hypothetical protein